MEPQCGKTEDGEKEREAKREGGRERKMDKRTCCGLEAETATEIGTD